MAKMQSLEDYRNYRELEKKIDEMTAYAETNQLMSNKDVAILEDLNEKKERLKLWWAKLNEQVLRSIKPIVDREKHIIEMKSRPVSHIQSKQVNFNRPELEKKDE
jgi:hypothetical protein